MLETRFIVAFGATKTKTATASSKRFAEQAAFLPWVAVTTSVGTWLFV
jgi:hypothetical protein